MDGPSGGRPGKSAAPILVGSVGLMIGVLFAWQLVAGLFAGDPTGLMRVSSDNAPLVSLELGRPVIESAGEGHDGYFFFQLAAHPILTDEAVISTFDDAPHRSSRILYPLIAGLGGAMPIRLIPWSLIVLNVVALGFGTAATAILARSLGSVSSVGLFFALNIGLLYSVAIDGASVLASALLVAGLACMTQKRQTWATVFFALSILSREFYAVFVVAALVFEHRDLRAMRSSLFWSLSPYLVVRLFFTWWFRNSPPTAAAGVRNFGAPFEGLGSSIGYWAQSSGLELLAVGLTMISAFGLVVLGLTKRTTVGMAGLAAVPFLLIFTDDILREAFDVSRVMAPLSVLFPLALVARSRSARLSGVN